MSLESAVLARAVRKRIVAHSLRVARTRPCSARRIGCFATAMVLCAAIVAAEPIAVAVVDRDLEIPLEGVVVRDPATGVQVVTDFDGLAVLDTEIPPSGRVVVEFSLIGYEPTRLLVRPEDRAQTVVVEMVIQGLLIADELVVEAPSIGTSDAQTGVSVVAERELIKTTAMIGPIEDVMNTVKVLPGVTYAGSFNSFLSVRGGDPGGLTHVQDGLVIKFPYHWGGGVSIFNPHMVESVKLSAGIFPVRYGQATSGLMDVASVNPTEGFRWSFAQSTSTLEGYVQVPLGEEERSGLLLGTRLTNYDLVFAMTGSILEDQGITFSRVPYIYSAYGRFFSRPDDRTRIFVNTFLGTDGIGVAAVDPDIDTSTEISDSFDFFWENRVGFVGSGVSRLVGDRLLVEALFGYEDWTATTDAELGEQGTRMYSDDFIATFGSGLGLSSGDTFSVDARSDFVSEVTLRHLQGRLDSDYQLSERSIIQTGGGAFVSLTSFDADGEIWAFVFDETGEASYRRVDFDDAAPDNRSAVSFAYTNWIHTIRPDRLEAELGVRVDHGIFYGDGYSINTMPTPGPRALLRYMPEAPRLAPTVTWTLGTGLFSKFPFDSSFLSEDNDVDDFEIGSEKNLMGVLGWQGIWDNGVRFQIEGYYKYVFDRFYVNQAIVSETDTSVEYEQRIYRDGIGHVGGFDFLLDRRTSRNWDGMLSYSFVYARYRNPEDDDAEPLFDSDPRGRWYYPSFHRFHSVNLIVNYRPTTWMTVTTKLTFATGAPTPRFGDAQMIAATIVNEDGSQTIAEMYTRSESYSDGSRDAWVLPLDVRVAFHWYREGSRRYNEVYLGVQDALSPILARYGPDNGEVDTDRYTGEDSTEASQQGVDFPIISIGFRLSF